MTGPCPYPCYNKNELGYCLTTGCINPNHNYFFIANYNPPSYCKACPNHPSNGGSGICHCTLGTPTLY